MRNSNAPLPHGGNVLHYSKKFGIPPGKIIDFSASVNPLGPPKKSIAAMTRAFAELNRYPDPDSLELTAKIAALHKLKDGQVLIGNGSTEFIYLLPRALGIKKALVLSPSFSDYERASEISGAKVVRLPLLEENNFSPDMKTLSREIKKCGLLFLCNPNNPTGTLLPKGELLGLLKEASKAGTVVCIDEAFIEYVPGGSVLKEAVKLGAVVLRNFTKFYGMPGIRIGYAAADRRIIAKMKAIREPWTVNNLAQAAALAALGDREYVKKTLAQNEAERDYLFHGLSGTGWLLPFSSTANFLLVKILEPRISSSSLTARLASSGLLVRDCSTFPGLGQRFLRVAVLSRRENKKLVEALQSFTTP
ncbi:MAG: threonine-phosphate decarboxylase CobD [Nitrospirota bacterium]